MKFKLDFDFSSLKQPFKHGDEFLLIGSCFADEMEPSFVKSGFKTVSNPFGTLFHPLAITHILNQTLNASEEISFLERNGVFFAWEAGAKVFGYSEDELKNKIRNKREDLKRSIKSASCVLLTFGTAWGYVHNELDRVVGNCHKVHPTMFNKSLSTVDEMTDALNSVIEKLKEVNPTVQVILTVSPVRHIKDGLIENNRSKARLIETVHKLSEKENVSYFPAYEIVMDELRDYRFFKSDLVHPTKDAVNYVWDAFEQFSFHESTCKVMQQVRGVNQSLEHKSLHESSEDHQTHIKKSLERKESISNQFPAVFWEK